jgi:hypothetical protein
VAGTVQNRVQCGRRGSFFKGALARWLGAYPPRPITYNATAPNTVAATGISNETVSGGGRSFKAKELEIGSPSVADLGPGALEEAHFHRDAPLASGGVQDQPEPRAEERECDPRCLQRNRDGREDNQERPVSQLALSLCCPEECDVARAVPT